MNTDLLQIPSKRGKIKKYHKILAKFKRILLNIIKITSGTQMVQFAIKVPNIAKFGTIWNYLELNGTKWDFFGTFLCSKYNSIVSFLYVFTIQAINTM